MNIQSKGIRWIDPGILFCLSILIFILPVAHTITIRTFAFYLSLTLLIVHFYLNKDFKWVKTSFELPFLAFFLVAAASLLTAHNFQTSLQEIWKNILLPILYFYTVYLAVRKEKDALLLISILIFANFIFSIYSLYEFKTHGGTWFSPQYRANGVKGSCEVNGLYQTMIIPFILWGLFYVRKGWGKVILFIFLILNIIALHITFTRAAYFALGVQLLITIGLLFSKKRLVLGMVVIASFIIVSSIYLDKKMFREMHSNRMPTLQELISLPPEKIVEIEPGSAGQRLAMWKTAFEIISRNPFYAHGYGRFNFGDIARNDKSGSFIIYDHTHNTFVSMAFELGIQGLIIFLWMIGTFLVVVWKNWRRDTDSLSHYFSASLLTMMAGYWVGNFSENFDADDIKLLFMTLLGIGMAIMHRIPKERMLRDQEK